jgi:hypothetical protein
MKRFVLALLASFPGLLFLAPGSASAQMNYMMGPPAYGPFYSPMLSPYLNLLRGGNPAANYFLGVLPEYQRRMNARAFSGAIQSLDQRAETPPATPEELELYTPLKSTGHATAFNNTLSYFPRMPINPRQATTRPGAPSMMAPGGTTGRPPGR